MISMMRNDIEDMLRHGQLDEAYEICRQRLRDKDFASDSTLWFLYGKTLWALGRRAEAESAYRHSVDLNPDSPARIALEMSEDISAFFNPDIMNP